MPQTDMTRGPIRPALMRYALPLMLGNLFQLTYHLVDAVIAGRFIGPEALAAEGIASPVMNLLILFISGLSLGTGVLMSELFGARKEEKLRRALATVLLFGLGFSLVLAAAGVACALQQAVQPVGKLLIQGCVNGLGMEVIAAYNAVTRVDDFAYIPEQSIAQSITTFTAQNRGRAGRDEDFDRCRIHRGFRTGMLLEAGYWAVLCAAVLGLRGPILSLFSADGDAAFLREGSDYLGLMAFLYLLPAMTNGVQGYFRGCGRMRVTLLATLTQTALRVVFTFLLAPHLGIRGIAWACAAGWCAMLLWEVPLYLHSRKQEMKPQRIQEG